ncbi:hypothetical protein Syun_009617 [Stephania yunnanensis]|uniref:Uncharacterized protein n=1 Tax=Stephania yunnanensis TaxID=152371 RepID=A0AAP0KGG7_9MAGN
MGNAVGPLVEEYGGSCRLWRWLRSISGCKTQFCEVQNWVLRLLLDLDSVLSSV